MNNCPSCFYTNTQMFMQLNETRKLSFCDYSTKYYDGLLESWLDKIQPALMYCDNCGHVYYKDIPDENLLAQMYASVKRPASSPDPSRPPSDLMVNEMTRLLKITGKKKPALLDYGAGYGRWSAAAYQVGFNVISFEPHVNRIDKDCDYDVIHDPALLKGLKFDVVWLEQVLEHVPKPSETLQGITQYMKPDSILRMSVPNIYRAKEGKSIWDEWPYNGVSSHILAPYQHLHGFSQSSLEKLVVHSGYRKYFSKPLFKYDAVYLLRMLLGKNIRPLSTTKCYLRLDKNL
jgi:2-polyprenyl-3-methyl-5-hydroxy-6-metoxy-1,4-benzoquinol methylase